MTVHVNEFFVANVLPFIEVVIIAVVHIKVDTTKEKFINVHIQDRRIIQFISYAEGLFYKNLADPSMFTNPINKSVNPYLFLSTVKQNSESFAYY